MPFDLVFMGTPEFAVPTLHALHRAGHRIRAVYTRAPAPGGRRGLDAIPSPIERAARVLSIPVRTPKTLRDAGVQSELANFRPDLLIVAAYGLILPQLVLDIPRLGALNLHASRLPRWRGAAPIQRAILAGDRESGVTLMRMEAGLDTGPIGAIRTLPIPQSMSAGELEAALMHLGAEMMVDALQTQEEGRLAFTPQDSAGVTYAEKIAKEEAELDFRADATAVHDRIRAFSPWPGAFTFLPTAAGRARLKILRAKPVDREGPPGVLLDDAFTIGCGRGAVQALLLQQAGGRVMEAQPFLRGLPLGASLRLG